MKPESILQADILDIIFENRNKEYGAYNLRKGYNQTMIKALAGTLLISIVFCIMNFINFSSDKEDAILFTSPDLELTPVDLKKVEPPRPPEAPKEKTAARQFVKPVIVDQNVEEPLPEIKELAENILIGTQNIDGPPALGIEPVSEPPKNIIEAPVEVLDEKTKIVDRAEFMPEFPGGHAAFMRFLSKNLRVPDDVVEPGKNIKILVQFVVGKEGDISDIRFLRTNGEVFEHEVIRVLRKMPTWKPGMQNGEKVAVYFRLPVVFETHEE
jgi:protein TonB